ncbi:hypothetical protein MAC_03276 [Metarhizium acridum CQMa 102]|uniref:Uncharacterized protein n=1 Tax=Metarhizium acridum (strain CQMa 102) TaxID=655827 RepID=E9E095_METAQ|nr:uncharacterized protein MAC_03276 [Metarhizium acridum CQMa 102]XP_007816062.1 uncharacterized protein MAC_09722 [Metarhizium acridum CQMa 102]XP_007816064.1 uncharacterized protein MAC_09724 [Metarhizium acridum CQMa 102]EFY84228.1 hypothetical protein MAC_09722 [Metarhizium acridum CQMa 102]EFY84230.1 hypothetical protein MAC_09724 [Metarhizium acridum CQMa 102]EFY90696.1 hypothetical protein MAC_03276 [Metarhizium acridum CQMa 102]
MTREPLSWLAPDSSVASADEADTLVRRFALWRDPLQPGYNVLSDEERREFYAQMTFNDHFQQLTLLDLHTSSPDIAVSYMHWASWKIHIRFNNLNKPHETHWEEVEEQKKKKKKKKIYLARQDHRQEEYKWTTFLPHGESAELRWITKHTRGMSRRNFTLLDQKTNEALAEFISDKNLHMGGVLRIKIRENGFGFDHCGPKILMSFLVVYETLRRRSHRTMYRSSKGNTMHQFCYRTLEFLLRLKVSKRSSLYATTQE